MTTENPKRAPFRASRRAPLLTAVCAAIAGFALAPVAQASSHREGPSIAGSPRVDGTDFYMFRSYESGRTDYVTMIANYLPLQDPAGGPNFFKLDQNALYEISIDNNGDAKEDLTFQFRFQNLLKSITLPIGNQNVPIPLTQAGSVTAPNAPALNVNEKFSLTLVRGDRRTGTAFQVTNLRTGSATFDKPSDNIGTKTIPDYAGYAAQHIYTVSIPGCEKPGRVFVGQRQEGFAVNLGVIFDLVNAPLGLITDPTQINAAGAAASIQNKNITSLALEVHKSCLTQGSETVIGGWTSASVRQNLTVNTTPASGYDTAVNGAGSFVQVSRLGMPLVNEVIIGLPDKDKFNASAPSGDGQFATYVTNPTLPALLEIALNLPGAAPKNLPRMDLVTTFLTGIAGVNQPAGVVASEMLRLNTAIAPVPYAQQNRLGIVGNILAGGSDNAGYPNGRRPKDDIVDISLVAVMGGLCVANGTNNALGFGAACNPSNVPLGGNGANSTVFKLHDAVDQAAVPFLTVFPYLNTPLPGAQ